MLDTANAHKRRELVSTLVQRGVPTTKIASHLGVPVTVVRSDRLFLSTQEPLPDTDQREKNSRKAPLSREDRRAANNYQKLPEVVAKRRTAVIKLYAEGKTDNQISIELGVSPTTIARDRVRLGIPPKDFTINRTERLEKVDKMLSEGKSKSEIARTLGVHVATVIKDSEKLMGKPVPQSVKAAARRAIVRQRIAENHSVKSIAKELGVAENSVRRYLETIAQEDSLDI